MGECGYQQGRVDLSPGVTTVAFDPVVPPLRIPVRAGVEDDPSKGEWLLAFKDEESWTRGWQRCQGKLSEQCEMGARMGCSITAANVCRVQWWKQALVFKVAKLNDGEREACEKREMRACLAGSKEACTKYARDTCHPIFAGMRVAESHITLNPRFRGLPQDENASDEKNPESLLANKSRDAWGNEDCESSERDSKKQTKDRSRKLMDTDSIQRSWDSPAWSEKVVGGGTLAEARHPVDGWEGGLITPKFDSQSGQSGDQSLPDARKEKPIWQVVRQRVESLFRS